MLTIRLNAYKIKDLKSIGTRAPRVRNPMIEQVNDCFEKQKAIRDLKSGMTD